MEFLTLLGKRLKDDEVAEMLERDDVAVTYDFDRSHENIEDRYWAAAQEKGYQLRFDAHQILDVIFIYVQSREGFSPIAKSEAEDIRFFASAAEVEAHCTASNLPITCGGQPDGPAPTRHWARIDLDSWEIHYEFRDGQLAMITISIPKKV